VLKIRSHSIFGTHHSWAVTMRSLFGEFIKDGHDPYIQSINKYSCVPKEWEQYCRRNVLDPDLDISYTAPINFHSRFTTDAKVKAAIYNYETIPLPEVFGKAYEHVDYVLPSSEFSKRVFVEAGWPEEKLVVVPHGIHMEDFNNKDKLKLRNKNTFRFLNVSIAHYRKNIPLLVQAYYDAFTSKDDVCLVIKTQITPTIGKKRNRFEQLVARDIALLQDKMIQNGRAADSLPLIELIEEKFPSMVPLYNSCDVLVSATSAEGFGIPLLEGLAANMLVIAPRCTGQLDFLNDNNSLLVDVATMKASPQYQYWTVTDKAWTYIPIKKSLSMQMRNAFENDKKLRKKFKKGRAETLEQFTWENAAKQILELV
jgi:O-antigen biosynthesis alpha-1,2-mannosyltransferase